MLVNVIEDFLPYLVNGDSGLDQEELEKFDNDLEDFEERNKVKFLTSASLLDVSLLECDQDLILDALKRHHLPQTAKGLKSFHQDGYAYDIDGSFGECDITGERGEVVPVIFKRK